MPHPGHRYGGLLNQPDTDPTGWPRTRVPPSLLAAAEEWGRTEGQMTTLERQQEMDRQRAMAGEPGYASIGPPQSGASRILDHLRHGIPRRAREFLEPETPAEMGGLLAASVTEPAGTAIDLADFAIGFKEGDLPRMGWAAGGAALPFVAGSTMRKVLGRGAKAADELPMDEASRMARAADQDFTINAFHGTSVRSGAPFKRPSQEVGDLERFHWGSHFGTQKAANERLDDLRPRARNRYGKPSFDSRLIKPAAGERIMPVKLRGKYLDIGNESAWHPEGLLETARRRGLITADELEHAFDNVPLLREAELGPNYNKHKHNEEVGIAMKQAVTDLFKRKGFAGVSYKNDVEDAGSISYMVFDPANIRSSMAAAFDPAQAESASLVAGTAGLLGTGLARNQRERERE